MAKNEQYNIEQHEQARPRALYALALRDLGHTWREVGERLGVTAQRAQALAAAHEKQTGKSR